MAKIEETLAEIGFDEKEIQIYLALLEMGEATASRIALQTRIERTSVYYIAEKLIHKGLISFNLRNNVKYYSASNPEKILEDLKDKQDAFAKILPMLNQIKNKEFEEDVKVDVFKGFGGLKAVYNDIIKSTKEVLVMGEEGRMQEEHLNFLRQTLRKMHENKIKQKVILREDYPGKIFPTGSNEFRYISKELMSPIVFLVYEDKVHLEIYRKPLFLIRITSKEVADSFRSYFKYFWERARKA